MVKPDLPTMVVGNKAALVTIALPLVAVTVKVRVLPRLDGLNGICVVCRLPMAMSVLNAFAVSAHSSARMKENLFIELGKR